MIAKSVSIESAGCISGGCAWKAVELTSGDLLTVGKKRLRVWRRTLTGQQKSAEGLVASGDWREGPNGPLAGG